MTATLHVLRSDPVPPCTSSWCTEHDADARRSYCSGGILDAVPGVIDLLVRQTSETAPAITIHASSKMMTVADARALHSALGRLLERVDP